MAKKTDLEKGLAELDKLKSRGVLNDEEYASRRAALVSDTSVGSRAGGGRLRDYSSGAF